MTGPMLRGHCFDILRRDDDFRREGMQDYRVFLIPAKKDGTYSLQALILNLKIVFQPFQTKLIELATTVYSQ